MRREAGGQWPQAVRTRLSPEAHPTSHRPWCTKVPELDQDHHGLDIGLQERLLGWIQDQGWLGETSGPTPFPWSSGGPWALLCLTTGALPFPFGGHEVQINP